MGKPWPWNRYLTHAESRTVFIRCYRGQDCLNSNTWIVQGYKHVVGLLKRAMTKGKKDRITVFYIISNICRSSRSQMGSKDKYSERLFSLQQQLFLSP